MNLLKGKPSRGGFETVGGAVLPLPSGRLEGPGVYGIRPEHMRLAPHGGIPAVVQLVEPTGSETQVSVRIGDSQLMCVFRERILARPGDVIGVLPDIAQVHLFDGQTGRRITA
jgi:multiple sugar transport system ATP-binding protein